MKLTSAAFANNGAIPSEYTCDGNDLSPPLSISDVPSNAKSLALISDDPDAPVGTWDHWVVFNIPPTTKEIPKGTEPKGTAGKNSWGRTGYGGPCPPSGTHRYFFKLYALDTILNLQEGSAKKDIESAMQGHIIAQTQLVGLYKRK
ncbi:YbhB/YbcL family Raf kinase inhibitor-like protein [Candidatus Woesearchaeota archaeon]|nr:YbhB/YbcL family Raf kinase inhibitor-like protein [Candidatus Woesearchaeota archaeon]